VGLIYLVELCNIKHYTR